ncbi:MAG: indolepyruvate ferredoxin oxidoreductase subunit alpha [Angelakisella sp.]
MKQLMLGNEGVARGLYESGCSVISSYPGTPSTEITEYAANYPEIYCEWAPNEKVAYEVAVSAAIGGVRSFCAMKHVGLNVAADPLFTTAYTGINAGLIIAVADDQGMHSSQNEQDSRHYAIAAKVPMLEPVDSRQCIDFVAEAYRISEQFDTPTMLRLSTRVSHSQSIVQQGERTEVAKKPYQKNPAKYVMMPAAAQRRHVVVEERSKALAEYAETTPLNRVYPGSDGRIGIITAGICFQYAREAMPDAPILCLGMVNPLPKKRIEDFAASVERVVVIEELDGIIETHCATIGVAVTGKALFGYIGEISQSIIRQKLLGEAAPACVQYPRQVPVRPPVLCPGCPHRGVFYTLSRLGVTVFGDIGCYTLGALPPLGAIDTTLCMGASVSGLHGFLLANGEQAAKKSVAVIGDSTFVHSGITGLINSVYNGTSSTIIIMDNSITGMTGHQQNPTTGYSLRGMPAPQLSLEALCTACGVGLVTVVDPADLAATRSAVEAALAFDGVAVVITRRPCALLKGVKRFPAVTVAQNDCIGCKRCMGIGCPAITMENGKASVDSTLCVGCGLCMGLCPKKAIQASKEGVSHE